MSRRFMLCAICTQEESHIRRLSPIVNADCEREAFAKALVSVEAADQLFDGAYVDDDNSIDISIGEAGGAFPPLNVDDILALGYEEVPTHDKYIDTVAIAQAYLKKYPDLYDIVVSETDSEGKLFMLDENSSVAKAMRAMKLLQ